MIILIDNYDSFTYNVYHYLKECGADVLVFRNDKITLEEIKNLNPDGIVISPGPCSPTEAGICLDLFHKFEKPFPIFGICLGFQALGQAFGGVVCRGPKPMHAKITPIYHDGAAPIFTGVPSPFLATRYHSLIVEKSTLPECLVCTATSEDGIMQGLSHKTLPYYGVQFHPESIASEHGHQLIQNFLNFCMSYKRGRYA